ncbi:MAG: hypothetical protein AMJ54_06605 [Deltaproteobacteria bacterium SG8_13]|nr:MAG: hypothetical protein AMJ54_06605 [Deltaproteobacteria bacterium SG8_13]
MHGCMDSFRKKSPAVVGRCSPSVLPMSPTRIGIVVFTSAALAGPWYTVEGYSIIGNLISQLGAQNTQNSWVMAAGFLALGCGIITDGIRRFSRPGIAFMAFGLFVALAGIFAHKPLWPAAEYSVVAHQLHSVLATLAGISITIGLLWVAASATSFRPRIIAIALAVLCFALPLCMVAFDAYQGLIQRVMYALILAWLWIRFPFD